MIADILEKQHVRRRANQSFVNKFFGGTHSRYGDGFVRQLRQKPALARRKFKTGPVQNPNSLKNLFSRSGRSRPDEKTGAGRISGRPGKRPYSPGFSFKVPSLATLLVIAGILIISLVALNWQGERPSLSPGISLPSGYSADPDDLVDRNLASYVMKFSPEAQAPAPVFPPIPAPEEDISLDLKETFAWSSYKVKRGDSVYKIASDFGVSMDAIIASNDISNARRLREGDTLRIPNMDGIPYTVKKGDNLSKIAISMKVPLEVILDANDLRSDIIVAGQSLFIPGARMSPEALKLSLGELFIYPIRKNISSGYGWRADPFTGEQRFHYAVDLKGNTGTPVKAAMDGTVSALVRDSRDYGNYIILRHSGGYRTVYAHLSAFSVKLGDKVIQGNKIGEVGSTGRSTGPHLHFQIYKDGRAVNPIDLLH
jgi:murein DD-endopeptidase MepM/ murein hydrolase activator NlpD